ncbi:HAMP domain-containing histidine kinase [Lachnospiraceae bacterium OttesenSCG-928-J05]|nr:HAMP domain-containing histidine kinase [Lachnospiraceae bacterium OttesenSCG-928-J05]
MRSTLYLKFLITYIVVGFFGIFIVSLVGNGLLDARIRGYYTDTIYKETNVMASEVFPEFFLTEENDREEMILVRGMEKQLDAAVWLVDTGGTMVASSTPSDYASPPSTLPNFNPAEIGNKRYLTGNYHGFFDNEVITVIAPVAGDSYITHGYLMVHKHLADIDVLRDNLMYIFYLVALIIYLLSFAILITFNLFVYRPLRKITEAAQQYASGNLEYTIPVTTEDEMGYLSASLNSMSNELKHMEEAQKKFIGNVSHDFRSPLTSIKGYLDAMMDGTIPEEMYDKYFKVISYETQRLTDLAKDLLTLNTYDNKGLILNYEDFDIHEVIRQIALSFEGLCKEKKISIDLVFATKTLSVWADKKMIEQVLYNLIDNAIKFSDVDSLITIETTDRGDKVGVSVKDYGVGIPAKELNKIWDRFYKSDTSRGKDKKGTGLGLSIVRDALKSHNENITVLSTEGVGTEFTFSLSKRKPESR